ncbi:uncharacterized protein LOC111084006 [Limulus polyphemus]|uniref:Uncharacterized protein LOC111084006 n=1 Tax=Limulus polyphemus TaxID=6850 RepID=A0ABM1RYM6_LIMPO|nr:uncharacterized protein LOC111084006 [Limulus polyphemus]
MSDVHSCPTETPLEVNVKIPVLSLNKHSKTTNRELSSRKEKEDKDKSHKSEGSPRKVYRHLERRETSHMFQLGLDIGTSSLSTSKKTNSEDLTQTKSKLPKAGWKTSKFFSRTLTSGELLKGLKKFSIGNETENKSTEAKMLKSKRSLFQKRASSEEGPNSSEKEEYEERQPPTSTSENSSPYKKFVEKEGIVCKKEDLLSIIKPKSDDVSGIALQPTWSVDSSSGEKPAFLQLTPTTFQKRRLKSRKMAHKRSPSDDTATEETVENVILDKTIEETKHEQSSGKEEVVIQIHKEPEGKPEDEHATVLWGDGNVLNAILLGDAIETFLKGSMCGGGSEKRVSFKK